MASFAFAPVSGLLRRTSLAATVASAVALVLGASVMLNAAPVQAQSSSRLLTQAEGIRPLDSVVATVNGEDIRFAEVVQVFSNLGPQFQQLGLTNVYDQVVERLVEQRLMVQRARDQGLHETEGHKAEVQFLENSLLEQQYLNSVFSAEITEEDIRAAYDAFEVPSETRAAHILVTSEEAARAVIARLDAGEDFAELAKSESTGPSGPNGGDLGYFTAEQMVAPFSAAAFTIEPGTYGSEPIQTQFGWHIIKVEDRRAAAKPPFEELREGLGLQLQETVLNTVLEELRDSAAVDVQPLK